jgi:hypothetical protein
LNRQGRQERQGNQIHNENQTVNSRILRVYDNPSCLCFAITLPSPAFLGVLGDLGGSIEPFFFVSLASWRLKVVVLQSAGGEA